MGLGAQSLSLQDECLVLQLARLHLAGELCLFLLQLLHLGLKRRQLGFQLVDFGVSLVDRENGLAELFFGLRVGGSGKDKEIVSAAKPQIMDHQSAAALHAALQMRNRSSSHIVDTVSVAL